MPTALIINGAQPYPFAKGALNGAFADRAETHLLARGWQVLRTTPTEGWDVEAEIAKHQQADALILQMPVNWMGWPWKLKQYMDEVYTAGMDGRLCDGDGRTSDAPTANYGAGGTPTEKKYMISLTFNAPAEAFDDPSEFLFQGRSVDDLMWPQHMNFRFFGMEPLATFAAFDVMKNPAIEADFARFDAHLATQFAEGDHVAA
ncbi:MAG: NAD(P)H-dependent oxidoreductase [Pseudomonadota bacterium]